MAYTVSQDFKDRIKDGTIPKSCLVLFDDLFFSTSDFTDSGVVFNQFFNTSEDLTFGDCPSDTLSFAVIANGKLGGYSFGKCRAYIGVQTASESYAFGDINAHIEVGGYTWTASETGLYCDGTLIDSDEYVSLVSDGTKVYAVGTSSSYSANIDGSDGAEYLPHAFMAQKLRSGLSAVFEANTAQVWDGEDVITIEYVPMGQYNVVKPRSTVGDIVEIQDAYDNMNLFDADASQFLDSLTYPVTLSGIYTALCDFVGVEYVTDTFLYSDTSYASSPFADTSCSLRDILWWIAERARAVAHCDREGRIDLTWLTTSLDIFTAVGATTGKYINASGGLSSHSQWSATDYLFVYPNTEYTFSKTGSGGNASCFAFYTEDKEFISSVGDETTLTFTTPSNARYARFSYRTAEESTVSIVMSATEVLTASDIGQDGYSVAEYKTPEVTGVLLRSGNGTTLSFGLMTAPYMISANPFVSTITNEDLEAYESIPTYIPMEIMVLEADPSVDIGDMIDVRPMVDEILALTNVYDEVYSEDDEALSIEAPTYQIPLMNRTLTFMGGIRASYIATGNETREADLSNTEYNASVAPVTQTDVFNRLTNGGEAQGIYLDNGKIYVNAEYIATGILASRNGDYWLNMDTGEVHMASAEIAGGSIRVTPIDQTYGYMILEYATSGFKYVNTSSCARTLVEMYEENTLAYYSGGSYGSGRVAFLDYAGGRPKAELGLDDTTSSGGAHANGYLFLRDSVGQTTAKVQLLAEGNGALKMYDTSAKLRMLLDPLDGLTFYKSDGVTVSKKYSAT